MNKIVCKSLSIFMAVIMLFTAVPMLVSAEGEVDVPTFAVEKVSETPTNLTLKIALKNGSFQCFDATLTVDGATCTSIALTEAFEAFLSEVKNNKGAFVDCENAETGKISVSVTESCNAPMDVALYSFTKSSKSGIVSSDIELTFESCYVDAEGEDIAATTVSEISVPETHTHVYAEEDWYIVLQPSCSREGMEKVKCSECGEVASTRSIAKVPHGSTYPVTTPATCTEAGSIKHHCYACNELVSEEVLPATGHVNIRDERVEPTCTEAGSIKHYCKDCEVLVSEEPIPATGHVNIRDERVEPTCTEAGSIKHYCKDCGVLVSEEPIPATGHVNTREEKKDPTCTEDGYKKVYCKDCDVLVSEEVLPATGHDITEERVEPTCTKDGYTKEICKTCGTVISETVLPKKGHGETRTESVAPNCTEPGYVRHYCSDCGDLLNEVILDATGHLYVEEKKLADCHEDGYIKISCSVCHEVFSHVISRKTEHQWTSWAVLKQPTYRSKGLERRTCRICGDAQERDIPMIAVAPTGVKMSLNELTMNYKQTSRLNANVMPEEAAFSADVVWTSSNPKVITVDENGIITAVGKGTAVVTASTTDGKFSDSCNVTVQYSWIQKIIIYVLFGWLWY